MNDTVPLRRLGEVTTESRIRLSDMESTEEATWSVVGVSREGGITDSAKYQSDNVDRYKVLHPGEFAYNPMRLNIGSIGWRAHVDPPALVSPDYVVFRCDDDLNPQYLHYLIQSDEWKAVVEYGGRGSVRKRIYYRELAEYLLPIPNRVMQDSIVEILGALDDKIELNRKMNATLDELARTIFRSWFVDFDPVRAKMEGREPFGMDAETATLFPDRLVASPLGPIPEGWSHEPIDRFVISIANGGTPRRGVEAYWHPGTVNWFKTGELTDGPLLDSGEKITLYGLSQSSAKLWPEGTVLVALYASPTVGRLGILTKPSAANQACSGLICREEYGNLFVFHSILATRAHLQNIATGAAQQNISKGVLQAHKIVDPGHAIAGAFQRKISSLYELQVTNVQESETLAELRDTLLPELISGRIRVPEAEKAVAEVV